MWRSVRFVIPNSKIPAKLPRSYERLYSTPERPSTGGSGKLILGIIASTGIGFTGAIVYGKYDPKFKSFLENVPYVNNIYKMFQDEKSKVSVNPKDDPTERKLKAVDRIVSPDISKKKVEREKATTFEVPAPPIEPKPKPSGSTHVRDDKHLGDNNVIKAESGVAGQIFESSEIKEDFSSYENALNETLEKLKKVSEDAINAQKRASSAVKLHTKKLYEALDLSEGQDGDLLWKETNQAGLEKEKTLKIAKQKAAETKVLIEKLKVDAKNLSEKDSSNPLVRNGDDFVSKCLEKLKNAESEVAATEQESKTASEYEHLVKNSKDQFRKELQIVLPNYLHGDKDKSMTEGDLNLLLAHAHRRIEQLQKQIAKQQVTEKVRLDEAIRNQKMEDEQKTEFKVHAEMQRRHLDLESAVEDRVASVKANFEADLHQQLLRQAAAHADHLQEVLKIKEQELDRKHLLELEEKLLHQKGVFISETSGNMARLKGIVEYLKAKSEFDESFKKAQALWLASQAMNYKVTLDKSGNLSPLAKDIAALKIAADEDGDFINSVISSIPPEAVNRGVVTNEILKQRFENVKCVCRKVALIDENNDSLYRYFLSYLQAFLLVDTTLLKPKDELEGKVAVDTSEWDTFDILSRISYCLKIDDMEQALRFANQLKGEPRAVAKDWMNEVKLLLETQLAVKALLAHAAAVGVQAYH